MGKLFFVHNEYRWFSLKWNWFVEKGNSKRINQINILDVWIYKIKSHSDFAYNLINDMQGLFILVHFIIGLHG